MRCPRSLRSTLTVLACCLAAVPVAAQVKLVDGPDGRPLLVNQPPPPLYRMAPRRSEPASDLLAIIERHARARRLDPLLVRALIQIESGWNAAAVSRKGAMGLMQLMPRTAVQLEVEDPFDPEANIRGGTEYLRLMLDIFDGDLTLALAGYNAGPEAVRRYGGVPPYTETRDYLRRVLGVYRGADFVDLPESVEAPGRRTFVVRRDGRLLMTTTPPSRH